MKKLLTCLLTVLMMITTSLINTASNTLVLAEDDKRPLIEFYCESESNFHSERVNVGTKITIDPDGGTYPGSPSLSVTLAENQALDLTTVEYAPTKEGYEFMGYDYSFDDQHAEFGDADSLHFKATYEPIINGTTVKYFNENGVFTSKDFGVINTQTLLFFYADVYADEREVKSENYGKYPFPNYELYENYPENTADVSEKVVSFNITMKGYNQVCDTTNAGLIPTKEGYEFVGYKCERFQNKKRRDGFIIYAFYPIYKQKSTPTSTPTPTPKPEYNVLNTGIE